MTRPSANASAARRNDERIVARPRASDAVGKALRNAFDPQNAVPADMMHLLHRLDGQSLGTRETGAVSDRG